MLHCGNPQSFTLSKLIRVFLVRLVLLASSRSYTAYKLKTKRRIDFCAVLIYYEREFSMIKSGLKNYFVNLKYYFTPVGTLAIGMIIGLSVMIPATLASLSEMLNAIIAIIGDTQVDFNVVKDYMVNSVTSLDWSDPIASLKVLISADWLKSTLDECFRLISIELQPYGDAIAEEVNGAIAKVKVCIAVFIFFTVAGLICGYFLTKFLVRRNIAKRDIRKFFLSGFVGAVIATGLQILCVWLYTKWKPSVFFTTLLSLFLFASSSLLEAYLVHGRKKVEIKTVLNLKNCFYLLLTDFIIFYLSMILFCIAIALTNVFAGLFIGFAFVEIAFIVIDLNAEGYVLNLIPKTNEGAGFVAAEQ